MKSDVVSISNSLGEIAKKSFCDLNKSSETIFEILKYIDPNIEYPEWVNAGMALHAGGYSWEVWDKWSQGSSKYKPNECQEKWETFCADKGIGIPTLYQMAIKKGCPKSLIAKIERKEKRRLKPISWNELDALPSSQYLVKKLLSKNAMSVVYGESNTGKTFIALDIALKISLGEPWREMKVLQGSVVYVACEGGFGLKNRLDAFYRHYNLTEKPPFYLLPASVDLCNSSDDAEELIEEINKINNVQLIVIDTLSRALAGGNENSPDDMGAFIKACDKIREGTKAHVMVIHHSGKDGSKGARGHSSLRAAADTEIEIKKRTDGELVANITKQRDGATGKKFAFSLFKYVLSFDEEGEEISSCVAIPTDAPVIERTGQSGKALKILKELLLGYGQRRPEGKNQSTVLCVELPDFLKALKQAQISKSDNLDSISRIIRSVIASLKSDGFIGTSEEFIWVTDKADKCG